MTEARFFCSGVNVLLNASATFFFSYFISLSEENVAGTFKSSMDSTFFLSCAPVNDSGTHSTALLPLASARAYSVTLYLPSLTSSTSLLMLVPEDRRSGKIWAALRRRSHRGQPPFPIPSGFSSQNKTIWFSPFWGKSHPQLKTQILTLARMEDIKPLQSRKAQDTHPCLVSKRALRELHQKCLQYVQEKNVSYLDQSDVTELLGGSSQVKANIVADIMTQMVSQVQYLWSGRG